MTRVRAFSLLVLALGLLTAVGAGPASAKGCTAKGCAVKKGSYVNKKLQGTLNVVKGGVTVGDATLFGPCTSPQLGKSSKQIDVPVGRLFKGSAPKVGKKKTYSLKYSFTNTAAPSHPTASYKEKLAVTFSSASKAKYSLSIKSHATNGTIVQDCKGTLKESGLKGPARG